MKRYPPIDTDFYRPYHEEGKSDEEIEQLWHEFWDEYERWHRYG